MLSRRQFLASPLLLLLPSRLGQAAPSDHSAAYHGEIDLIFGLLTFALDGTVDEEADRVAGRYRVVAAGAGSGISNRLESSGRLRERRYVPTATTLNVSVAGRETRIQVHYDYDRGQVHYRQVSETFFLRRKRLAEDVIAIPPGRLLDDVVSATLNYAEGLVEPDGQGGYRTFLVRRARREGEGVDEAEPGGYRAEIVPVRFTAGTDRETGRSLALLDLVPFTSWASPGRPARITFGANRRPEILQVSLILGTTIRVKFNPIE